MQKTNFAFEVLIHDDASMDKTADIIREYEAKYPEIIKPIYQTVNQYSRNVWIMNIFQYPRVRGKYIALCEGDDYWIDSFKLQKQVDFLEKNLEYSFTAHRCMVFDETINKWSEYNDVSDYEKNPDGIVIDCKYNKSITHTSTLLFRKEALSEHLKFVNNGGTDFDFVLIYYLKKAGKGFCFNIKMSVYRLNIGGIYGKQSIYTKLTQGYNTIKKLYYTENNSITRKSYYSRYASVFVVSKGKILFQENFEIIKFLSLSYFLPLKFLRLLGRKFNK